MRNVGTGRGNKGFVAGIPVFYELKGWIGAAAANVVADIESISGDRLPTFERLAWAHFFLMK
jgi:hypothetical protein